MSVNVNFAVLGAVGTNCYVAADSESGQCIIIDPADNVQQLQKMISESGCQPAAILLTHGHIDHIKAAKDLKDIYNINIYAGREEEETLSNPQINLSTAIIGEEFVLKADVLLDDGQKIKLAGMNIEAIHTLGHTAGGMCYYIADENILFSGDTLFAESVGRTDFPGGSMSSIVSSIKNKLFVLPEDTRVFPGHGEGTSVKYEKQYNPFCQ